MQNTIFRSVVPVVLASAALLFTSASATTCYTDNTFFTCSWMVSNGPSSRWCGTNEDVFCPDEIVDDPDITIALQASGTSGKNKDSTWNPECIVTFKHATCVGGICVTSVTTTSRSGTESRVNPQSACTQSDPG